MTHPVMTRQARAALDAAERGWHVFPLMPRSKRPALNRWEQRTITDPARIAAAWRHAAYNVGLDTGPSRLVVVDLDTAKPGEDGPGGAAVLAALAARHGQLCKAALIYQHSDHERQREVAEGIDARVRVQRKRSGPSGTRRAREP